MRDCRVAVVSNLPEFMSSSAICTSPNGSGIKAYATIEVLIIPGKIYPVRRETHTLVKNLLEARCKYGYVGGDGESMDLCLLP